MSGFALFHFLRPWWLLLLLPALLLWWWQKRYRNFSSGWHQVVDAHLLPHLLKGSDDFSRVRRYFLPFFLAFLSIALSGPTWQRIPDQSSLVGKPLVIALELSNHMLSTDISPSRLKRALFKLKDLLAQEGGREIALIAFAGDAHVVVPLTTDHRTMLSLSANLDPSIMPRAGANLLSALKEASQMVHAKDVLVLSSTNDDKSVAELLQFIEQERLRVMVWPFASEIGAPLLNPEGRFDPGSKGQVQLSSLQKEWLSALKKSSLVSTITLSADDSDVKSISARLSDEAHESENQELNVFDTWYDIGPYFVALAALLFLLATALYGPAWWLFCLFLWLPSMKSEAGIADWFSRADQKAYKALMNNEPLKAAELYTDNFSKGSAFFKAQKYQEAASYFSKVNTTEAFYNLGNALAHLNKIPDAIKAYDEALKRDPKHSDALHNKELLEKLGKENPPPKDQEQKKEQQEKQEQGQGEEQQKNGGEGDNQNEKSPEQGKQPEAKDSPNDEQQKSGDTNQQKEPEKNNKEPAAKEAEQAVKEEKKPGNEEKVQARPDENIDPTTQYYFKQLEQNNNFYLKRKFLYESQKKAGQR